MIGATAKKQKINKALLVVLGKSPLAASFSLIYIQPQIILLYIIKFGLQK